MVIRAGCSVDWYPLHALIGESWSHGLSARKMKRKMKPRWSLGKTKTQNCRMRKYDSVKKLALNETRQRWPSKSCTRAPTCTGSSSYLDTSVSRNFGRFHFNQKIRFEFSATSSASELMAQHFPKFLKVGQPCGVYPNLQKFFPGSFLSIQPFCCSQDF